MTRAVFLDRDNTLIANDGDLGDPAEVRLLDGVPEGVRALREAGYRVVVVTNQGGVARGAFTEDDVDAVNQRIAELVDEVAGAPHLIDRFYYCPYHPKATLEEYRRDHPWRKPHPGMILQAARDMKLDLGDCWLVGDQARDVAAGQSAGCRTVLLGPGRGDAEGSVEPTVQVTTFGAAVEAILGNGTGGNAAGAAPAGVRRRTRADRGTPGSEIGELKTVIRDLAEEIRSERLRGAEFTGLRLAAGLCQLLALLLACLGLLQLGNTEVFLKWMIGAALVQMMTISFLLLDLKGMTPPEATSVTLRALDGTPLADPALRSMVVATAHAMGERQGIGVIAVETEPDAVTVTIDAPRLAALGFAAELRRITTAWYTRKYGAETLWGEAQRDDGHGDEHGETWKDA